LDGDVNTWSPSENYLMLIDKETPAKIWVVKPNETEWVLDIEMGAGDVVLHGMVHIALPIKKNLNLLF